MTQAVMRSSSPSIRGIWLGCVVVQKLYSPVDPMSSRWGPFPTCYLCLLFHWEQLEPGAIGTRMVFVCACVHTCSHTCRQKCAKKLPVVLSSRPARLRLGMYFQLFMNLLDPLSYYQPLSLSKVVKIFLHTSPCMPFIPLAFQVNHILQELCRLSYW